MNAFAYGGGGGGAASTASGDGSKKDATSGCDGGSGGGSALYRDNINDHILGGSAIDPKQGHSGGPSITGCAGGGGGGAGAAGSAGNGDSTGGAGGAGLSSDILGSEYIFAGGGGGGCKSSSAGGGLGGSSVGGAGGSNSLPPTVGLMGLGGGGGGGGRGTASGAGAAGGSGIVIIRCSPRAVLAENGYAGAKKGFIVGTFNEGGANDYVVYFSDTNPDTRKTFTVATAGYAEILVVGGGGAGGNSTPNYTWNGGRNTLAGGGGGAGGVVTGLVWLAEGEYTVNVGAGGTIADLTGGKSSIVCGDETIALAYGGGRGGVNSVGLSGACGGGGSGGRDGGAVSADSVDADNVGYAGGRGEAVNAGGGGGAGAQGSQGDWAGHVGNGGAGIASSITGREVWYAGGGAGGDRMTYSSGGKGGGGSSSAGGGACTPGTDELGGGGGGASAIVTSTETAVRYGARGGSGVVIVRLSSQVNDNYVSAIVGNSDVEVLDNGTGGKDNVFVFDDLNAAETDHYFTLKQNAYVRILTVGGGGSGGAYVNQSGITGGGGGGQVLDQMHYLSAGTYYVVTGKGGVGAQTSVSTRDGSPSYVKAAKDAGIVQQALGGGGGGNGGEAGRRGANGGGGGIHNGPICSGGSGSVGFGGGSSYISNGDKRAGGGGGAGAAGGTASASTFGTGGTGVYSDIRGLPESDANAWYGGGGAGGLNTVGHQWTTVSGGKGGGARAYISNAESTMYKYPGENGKGVNGDGTVTLVANSDTSVEPAHFQRVESIRSTGSQYLNTGYCPNAKTWMEAKLSFEGAGVTAGMNDARASVFGTWNSTATGAPRSNPNTYAGHFAASDNIRFIYESGAATGTGLGDVSAVLSDMTLVVQKTSVTAGTATATGADHAGTAAFPLYLFGCNAGGTGYAFTKFPQMSVRSWKIYESDTGTKGGANERLVRDFVPVIDTFENNRPGLYDRVEGKFYPSETGVDFVAGAAAEPAAYFGGKAKASIADAEGYSQVLQVANDHTVLVFTSTNAPGSFTVAEGGVARVLVIGGGGAGGDGDTSPVGGGGGAGAMIEEYDLLLTAGATYTVTVGAGGAGADTAGLPGNDGQASLLTSESETIVEAVGGGGGGGLNNWKSSPGRDGGSGGGSGWSSSVPGRALDPRYGHDGGPSASGYIAGGGGGAGSPGQMSPENYQTGKGGSGLANDITGSWVTYAAGGDGYGDGKSGVDGTGSGGNGNAKSCAGGSGVVIVHLYTKWSVATVTLDHNDGTGESDSVFAKVGEPMPELSLVPTRHAYVFEGYFDDATGGTQYYAADGSSAHVWDKDGDTTLYAHWTSALPPDYELLPYLDNGTSLDAAGYVVLSDFRLTGANVVELKYCMNAQNNDKWQCAFWSRTASNKSYSLVLRPPNHPYGCVWQVTYGPEGSSVRTYTGHDIGSEYVLRLCPTLDGGQGIRAYLNGDLVDWQNPPGCPMFSDEGAVSTMLFAAGYGDSPDGEPGRDSVGKLTGAALAKIYYFQVRNSETDSTLRLDLVPAKRKSTNVRVFYDLVSGSFYPLKTPVVLDGNGGTPSRQYVYTSKGEPMPALPAMPKRGGYDFKGYLGAVWEARLMTGNESDICNEGTTVFASMRVAGTLNTVAFDNKLSNPDESKVFLNMTRYTHDGFNEHDTTGTYSDLMKRAIYGKNDEGFPSEITIKGLNANHVYLFQFFVHDGRGGKESDYEVSVDQTMWYKFGQKTGLEEGPTRSKYGVTFVYRFVATAATEKLKVYFRIGEASPDASVYPQFNGIQLRDITAVSSDDGMYYDANGNPVKDCDFGEGSTLYAQWELTRYHVINPVSGPEIVVDYEWLTAAFGEKDKAGYQAVLFATNAQGVVAWQSYVLGFAADEVGGAAIAEETAQGADSRTMTVRLRDWNTRTPRTDATCRLAYSLYSARTPEAFAAGGESLVKDLEAKPFEKRPDWTFDAPLDDLTDAEPVNYYRIKVHFIFGED